MHWRKHETTRGVARTSVLVAAGVFGIATATLVYVYVLGPRRHAARAVPIITAATDISPRTEISPRLVTVTMTPESEVLPGASGNSADVEGKVTTTPFRTGEQITADRLTDKGSAFGLAALIPPGTRAMTVSVDVADAPSGFLQPGDSVDVLASFAQGDDSFARTILQNVKLLAVNASLRRAPAEGPPEQAAKAASPEPTTVKVAIAVTPAEAERLVAAQYKGKLKIVLRGREDRSRFTTAGASLNQMMGVPAAAAPGRTAVRVTKVPAPKRKRKHGLSTVGALPPMPIGTSLPGLPVTGAGPEGKSIRVIKGNQVQDVVVQQ